MPYTNGIVNYDIISEASRGAIRPAWELLYAHYVQIKRLDAPWTAAYLNNSLEYFGGFEGGAGSWGEGSGHYDGLGWGSLLHHLGDDVVVPTTTRASVAASSTSTSSSTVPSTFSSLSTSSSTSYFSRVISTIPSELPSTLVNAGLWTTHLGDSSTLSATSVTSTQATSKSSTHRPHHHHGHHHKDGKGCSARAVRGKE